ncbi:MAG: hypothetical protein HYV40_02180 [Candidatus Levybacteria bacterium]|nr:hypothetical protein [Candidatus Levybacteria bacterium]
MGPEGRAQKTETVFNHHNSARILGELYMGFLRQIPGSKNVMYGHVSRRDYALGDEAALSIHYRPHGVKVETEHFTDDNERVLTTVEIVDNRDMHPQFANVGTGVWIQREVWLPSSDTKPAAVVNQANNPDAEYFALTTLVDIATVGVESGLFKAA